MSDKKYKVEIPGGYGFAGFIKHISNIAEENGGIITEDQRRAAEYSMDVIY